MKISDLTLQTIAEYITGDGRPTERRSGPKLVMFFNVFGVDDAYDYGQGGLPDAMTRYSYTLDRLKFLCTFDDNKLFEVIECLADSRTTSRHHEIATELNDILKYDGYKLEENPSGIYKIQRNESSDPLIVEAHFEEIRAEIVKALKDAKYAIWVAVAWFSDRDLANILREKHRAGLNVRVVVTDEQNDNRSLDFAAKGIEYRRVAPSSPWGKKLMHHKFCVVDF